VLPLAWVRGATGPMRASGAMADAHLALQTVHPASYGRLSPTPGAIPSNLPARLHPGTGLRTLGESQQDGNCPVEP
jgi:hypothetical protein